MSKKPSFRGDRVFGTTPLFLPGSGKGPLASVERCGEMADRHILGSQGCPVREWLMGL
jgi:hypothetical protein